MASKSTKKSTGSSRSKKASVYSEEELRRRERNGILYIAAGILLGLYIFVAETGILGHALSRFFFGLCGLFTYFLPFVFVGMGILTIAGKRGKSTGSFGWVVTGILSALTLAETTTKPDFTAMQFIVYLKNAYETGATTRRGGGILGAVFCYPLQQLGGYALCYVATIALILLALLMLTRISILDIGIRVNNKVHSAVKRVRELEQEHAYERERERQLELDWESDTEQLRNHKSKPMRVFNLDSASAGTASAGEGKKSRGGSPVAEEPESEIAESLPKRRHRREEKDDLAAFNAFADSLPSADHSSARKCSGSVSLASSSDGKELSYLSETVLKTRPVRDLKGAAAITSAAALSAATYVPAREISVPRGDTIWNDIVSSGEKLTDGTMLPAEGQPSRSNTYHAAGGAPVPNTATFTRKTAVPSASAASEVSVSPATAVSDGSATVAANVDAVPAENTAAKSIADRPVTAEPIVAEPVAEPAEEPFDETPDTCPFDSDADPVDSTEPDEDDLAPDEAIALLQRKAVATVTENAGPSAVSSPVSAGKDTVSSATPGNASTAQPTHEATAKGNGSSEPEAVAEPPKYEKPSLDLLDPPHKTFMTGQENPEQTGALLVKTLETFGISTKLVGWSVGPVITQYELQPAPGIRVSKITSLSNDIALALAATRVRIEAPIPNKSAVGIEIPNKTAITVVLRDIIESNEFSRATSPITLALGRDTGGKVVTADLGKMPHLLIAGSTGSGKSVCINDLILSMVYKSTPEELRLILIDPKVVELSVYGALPHLLIPVVTEPKKASGALRWAVNEMTMRYKRFSEVGARDLARFNALQDDPSKKLYKLVVIIDELADLMMVAPDEVEDSICRIAQLGRAAGIHLIVATQRPSADIITGLIKANIPSRCAFAVSSGVDSRIILDATGAEKLLGRGDMLFHPNGAGAAVRVQGAYVSDEEVERVMAFFRQYKQEPVFDESVVNDLSAAAKGSNSGAEFGNGKQDDELLGKAVSVVLENGSASISMIQRRLRVGYARAARLVDMMEEKGYVSGFEGSKSRKVLIKRSEFEAIFGDGVWMDDREMKAAQAREEDSL